jgi:xanthine/uracil permease
MDGVNGNTRFTFQYIISLIVVLVVCDLIMKAQPHLHILVVILFGLVTGYITLFFLNNFFPYFTKFTNNLGRYFEYEILNNFTNMGYAHVWPPIMAILLVFIILLYGRFLG